MTVCQPKTELQLASQLQHGSHSMSASAHLIVHRHSPLCQQQLHCPAEAGKTGIRAVGQRTRTCREGMVVPAVLALVRPQPGLPTLLGARHPSSFSPLAQHTCHQCGCSPES